MRQGTWRSGSARPVVIAVLAGLNAVGAACGALGLAFGFLKLDAASASRLPWGSTVLAGIALGLLVGVPNAVLTVVAARRGAGTGPVSIGVGALLVGWILVELAFLRELSFFHPVYIAVGVLLVWLGGGVIRTTGAVSWPALLSQMRDVLVDLPVLATSPAYRRRHLRWGATRTEADQTMPGDLSCLLRTSADDASQRSWGETEPFGPPSPEPLDLSSGHRGRRQGGYQWKRAVGDQARSDDEEVS
jgi:hypothetical protein